MQHDLIQAVTCTVRAPTSIALHGSITKEIDIFGKLDNARNPTYTTYQGQLRVVWRKQ
eukprot:gene3839-1032_t